MKLQMVDLQGQYQRSKMEIDDAISEVLESAAFINGPAVGHFADELAAYNGVNHVVPCANGTDALQIAMMALNLKPGDEVIVPCFTYVATAEVIALLGLAPVFVDVDPKTFMVLPEEVEKSITPKTKAVVPVHLFGQCADMEGLLAVTERHHIYIIEDAAQAIGAEYRFSDGSIKKAGTIGTIGTTSFFPSKNLGCFGDGGALFVQDAELARKTRMIANHGQRVKYHHDIVGINSRLDTLQAAILRVKLKQLDNYSAQRNRSAAFFDKAFAGLASISIPERAPHSTHVFHQYTIKCNGFDREELRVFLDRKGIPTMVYYPVPLHLQKAYNGYGYGKGDFPVSEMLTEKVLSLPIHTEQQESELLYITEAVKEFLTTNGLT